MYNIYIHIYSLTMSLTGKFAYMAHHFVLLQLNPLDLSLGLIGRDGGLSHPRHSCRFACQQRVLKTFPGPWLSLLSENAVG